MMMDPGITTEQFLAEARRLRASADDAERAFFDYLMAAEAMPRLWEGTGHTFLEFLDATNLCRPARYDAYRCAMAALGSKADGVGVNALVAAGRLKTPEQQTELLDRARRFERTNGTSISEQSAEHIARDLRAADVVLRTRNKGIRDLDQEIETLRKTLATRDATIVTLRAELKQVRAENAELRGKRSTARAAA